MEVDYNYNPNANPNPNYAPNQPKPDNLLVWAILSTVLCCVPFGIVSIVYSTKVDSLWNNGQYAEAQDAASKAKTWAIIAAVSGIVVSVIAAIVSVVGGM